MMIFGQSIRSRITLIMICLSLLSTPSLLAAGPQELNIDLSGNWKFKKGDRMMWAQKELDDSHWGDIYVPSKWEEKGHFDYDGFAWYRLEIQLGPIWQDREVMLFLGKIDDVDEVFFNGVLIGSTGVLPPSFQTAWREDRNYAIPSYLLENGKNVIAIRVYDEVGEGGIYEGKPYLRAGAAALIPDIDLSGSWEFSTSTTSYLGPDLYRRKWSSIQVPANWESQGYQGYDGFAFYRRKISLPNVSEDELWVLLLGKIDDLDEVYIDGKLVGALGEMDKEHPYTKGMERDEFRGYYLPKGLLTGKKEHEILIKVYDGGGAGGIYQGPIGLISQAHYIQYWREASKANKRND